MAESELTAAAAVDAPAMADDAADAAGTAALAPAAAVILASICFRLSLSISFRSARCARSVCAAISLSLRRLTGTSAAAQVDRLAAGGGAAATPATPIGRCGAELGPEVSLLPCRARNARIESAVGEKTDEAECTSTRAVAAPPLPEPEPEPLAPPPGLQVGGRRLVCAPFEAAPVFAPPLCLAVRPPPAVSMAGQPSRAACRRRCCH